MTAGVAVISGAGGGIGLALAAGFRDAGYDVIGLDRAWGGPAPDGVRPVTLDIRDTDAVVAFGHGLEAVAVVVNAAGVIRRLAEFELPVFEEVLDINLTGSMRLASACRPGLAANGGAVINIASMFSYFGSGISPAYASSKGGVVTLTKSLAVAWAKDNIRVNALAPGWIATPLTRPLQDDPVRTRTILERTPMGRWGTPEDLVGPALFLASDAARFVTGVVLPVDGGYASM